MYLNYVEQIIEMYSWYSQDISNTEEQLTLIGEKIYNIDGINALLSTYNLLLETFKERCYSRDTSLFVNQIENNWKTICSEF